MTVSSQNCGHPGPHQEIIGGFRRGPSLEEGGETSKLIAPHHENPEGPFKNFGKMKVAHQANPEGSFKNFGKLWADPEGPLKKTPKIEQEI